MNSFNRAVPADQNNPMYVRARITNRFGLAQHWLHDIEPITELAASAARIDALIAIFAVGMLLGWLVRTVS